MPAGLLGIEELDRAEIEAILARAKDFQPMQSQSLKKLDTLRGKMIVNLFFEASTRTRTSFEIAAKRLGADAVSITASGSSVSQGRIAGGYAEHAGGDAAGRHRDAPRGQRARRIFWRATCPRPIINAGDGTHEHPTQALLDARTILDRCGHARRPARGHHRRHRAQPRGALQCPSALEVRREIVLCGPASLLPVELAQLAPGVRLTTDIREAIRMPTSS